MKNKNIQCAIEGILFAAGEPVKTSKIAAVLETDIEAVEEAVKVLKYNYDTELRGLMIIEIDGGYQLCSRPEYYSYIQEILGEQRRQALSNAAMEVLSIIAYKQPITRSVIEQIRGVSCDSLVNRLLERNLIEEIGRLDTPGRPMLFGTNDEFLRCFGISSVTDLPDYEKISSEQISIDSEDGYMSVIDEKTEEEMAKAAQNTELPSDF